MRGGWRVSSRPSGKARLDKIIYQCREGDLSLRAECRLAYLRWERAGRGNIVDQDVEIEAGAVMLAEADWDLHRIRTILEERPVMV